jgi:hypothetical protein
MKTISALFDFIKGITARQPMGEIETTVRKARKEFAKKYKKTPIDQATRALDKVLTSRYIAKSEGLGTGSSIGLPQLFSSHFEAEHFAEGSSKREKLLSDIGVIKGFFAFGMEESQCAANLLFARFLEVTKNPQKAEGMLCQYLNSCKQPGLKDRQELMREVLGIYAETVDGRFLVKYPDYIERPVRSIIGDTRTSPMQQISLLNNVVQILRGNGDDYVGRNIGVSALAKSDDTSRKSGPSYPGVRMTRGRGWGPAVA